MEENVCRICFNFVKKEFEVIDAGTRQMMELLLLKVDLDASKTSLLCLDCVESIKKFYFFKTTSIQTEEIIHSFSTTREGVKLSMKDVYKNSKGVDDVDEDLNVCRFCMNQIRSISSVDKLMKDVMYVEMFKLFMPEIVFNGIENPVICTSCWENLEYYFKFAMNCLDIEKKINEYRQSEAANAPTQIELSKVLSFLFKDTLTYPDDCTSITSIKQENLYEDMEENRNFEILEDQIKSEEALDIKDVNVSSEATIAKCEVYLPEETDLEMHKEQVLNNELKHKRNIKRQGDISEMKSSNNSSKVQKKKKHKCGICTYETRYVQHLTRHMLTHMDTSEIETYKCEICNLETRYKLSLKRHMLMHKDTTEIVMYKCEICTFETKHKKGLKDHMLSHKAISEVDMHKCTLCTFETKYKEYIRRHMLVHKETTEVEMHKCPVCSFEAKHKQTIKSHMIIHKDSSVVESEMYKCGLCSYEAKYKDHLKRHILSHKATSEVEMYKCQICCYESKYKQGLKRHMISHKNTSELVMHKCQLCSFESKYKQGLKRHIMLKHNNTQ